NVNAPLRGKVSRSDHYRRPDSRALRSRYGAAAYRSTAPTDAAAINCDPTRPPSPRWLSVPDLRSKSLPCTAVADAPRVSSSMWRQEEAAEPSPFVARLVVGKILAFERS